MVWTTPALEVDLTEKTNKTQKLLLGDDTPAGSADYAKLDGDPRVFTIASFNKTNIDKSVNDLRDKRLLTLNPTRSARSIWLRRSRTSSLAATKTHGRS